MIFKLSEAQIKNAVQLCDIALKGTGIINIGLISKVMNLFDKAQKQEDNFIFYDLNEEQLDSVHRIFDLALRTGGINVIFGVEELIYVFQNPIQEDIKDEIVEAEIIEQQNTKGVKKGKTKPIKKV